MYNKKVLKTLLRLTAATHYLFERFIAKKVCTARSRTNHNTVPLTNWNKYFYIDKSAIKVVINNSSEKSKKKKKKKKKKKRRRRRWY
jgi:hypothetical protein